MNKIILAPITLPNASPLELIAAGTEAGYDALALRLNASPGLPFHPVLGDDANRADRRRADRPDAAGVRGLYAAETKKMGGGGESLRRQRRIELDGLARAVLAVLAFAAKTAGDRNVSE